MKVPVASLMMLIVTTRGGDKSNHWAMMKLKRSVKLKWPTIDKLYRKAQHPYNNATAKKWKDNWKKMVNQLKKSSSLLREADESLLPSVKRQRVLRSATAAPPASTSAAASAATVDTLNADDMFNENSFTSTETDDSYQQYEDKSIPEDKLRIRTFYYLSLHEISPSTSKQDLNIGFFLGRHDF
ncbi:hypothetical protein PS6_007528 [Mucor atramentarius]